MYDTLIKNGTIVTPSEMFKADIYIKDGKIAAVTADASYNAGEVIDASGRYIYPGPTLFLPLSTKKALRHRKQILNLKPM